MKAEPLMPFLKHHELKVCLIATDQLLFQIVHSHLVIVKLMYQEGQILFVVLGKR